MKPRLLPIILMGFLSFILPLAHAVETVATVSFVRGSVASLSTTQESRLLGEGSLLYQGDQIQTAAKSIIIIVFTDGSKVTLEPKTHFSLHEYRMKADQQGIKLELHQGGIRVSTGKISKNDPNKFQIKTPLATLKGKQAEYSVRLCENDCKNEIKNKMIKRSKLVIGRIIKIQGTVHARNIQQQKTRKLVKGSPLYAKDQLISASSSYAVIAFQDGGRVTVGEKTEYLITHYTNYQQTPQKGQFFQKLVRGAIRVLTGKIGKLNLENYKMHTPVATIGIRGTGYDLYCMGNCIADNIHSKAGLYSHVWQGRIHQKNNHKQLTLGSKKSSYIAHEDSLIIILSKIPPVLDHLPIRPDKVIVNQDKLFNVSPLTGTPPGLYVDVHTGYVRLGSDLDLGENEAAYVHQKGHAIRIEAQGFQVQNPYPLPSIFNKQQAQFTSHSLLSNQPRTQTTSVYECVAK